MSNPGAHRRSNGRQPRNHRNPRRQNPKKRRENTIKIKGRENRRKGMENPIGERTINRIEGRNRMNAIPRTVGPSGGFFYFSVFPGKRPQVTWIFPSGESANNIGSS